MAAKKTGAKRTSKKTGAKRTSKKSASKPKKKNYSTYPRSVVEAPLPPLPEAAPVPAPKNGASGTLVGGVIIAAIIIGLAVASGGDLTGLAALVFGAPAPTAELSIIRTEGQNPLIVDFNASCGAQDELAKCYFMVNNVVARELDLNAGNSHEFRYSFENLASDREMIFNVRLVSETANGAVSEAGEQNAFALKVGPKSISLGAVEAIIIADKGRAAVNVPFSFSAAKSSTAIDNPELSYEWSINRIPDYTSSEEEIRLAFGAAGDYVVTLVVTDAEGNTGRTSVTVTVTEAEQEPAVPQEPGANPVVVELDKLNTSLLEDQNNVMVIEVRNAGSRPLTDYRSPLVRITQGEKEFAVLTLAHFNRQELLVGQSADTRFEWYPEEAGRHTLTATVDPQDAIEENDETDNVTEYAFTVLSRGGGGSGGGGGTASTAPSGSGASDDTTAPAKPATLHTFAGDGEVAFSWTPSEDADFSVYRIYFGDNAGFPANDDHFLVETADAFFVKDGLQNGTPYYFKVVPVDNAGNAGEALRVTAEPNAGNVGKLEVKSIVTTPANPVEGHAFTVDVEIFNYGARARTMRVFAVLTRQDEENTYAPSIVERLDGEPIGVLETKTVSVPFDAIAQAGAFDVRAFAGNYQEYRDTRSAAARAFLSNSITQGASTDEFLVLEANENNTPPTATLSADKQVGQRHLAVTFSATCADEDGTISKCELDFGDGTPKHVFPAQNGVVQTVRHNYENNVWDTQVFVARLVATDDQLAKNRERAQSVIILSPAERTVSRESAYWPGFDIVQAFDYDKEHMGYYMVDGFGAVHQTETVVVHIDEDEKPYWLPGNGVTEADGEQRADLTGWNIYNVAIDVEMSEDGRTLFMANAHGEIYAFGAHNRDEIYGPGLRPYFYEPVATGMALTPTGLGAAILTKDGTLFTVGDAKADGEQISCASDNAIGDATDVLSFSRADHARATGTPVPENGDTLYAYYVLFEDGTVRMCSRDTVTEAKVDTGGKRAVSMAFDRAKTGIYVLTENGLIRTLGTAEVFVSPVNNVRLEPNFGELNIARQIRTIPGEREGYAVLDGYGAIHEFKKPVQMCDDMLARINAAYGTTENDAGYDPALDVFPDEGTGVINDLDVIALTLENTGCESGGGGSDGEVPGGTDNGGTGEANARAIAGRVTDETGAPVAGVAVLVNGNEVHTGEDGTFSLSGDDHAISVGGTFSVRAIVPAGYTGVRAINARQTMASYQWQVLNTDCTSDTDACREALSSWASQEQVDGFMRPERVPANDLASDNGFDFELKLPGQTLPEGTIAGRVTDTAGAPVSGVSVLVNNTVFAQTGSDGRYAILADAHHIRHAGVFRVSTEVPAGYAASRAVNAPKVMGSYGWQVLGVDCAAGIAACEQAVSDWADQTQLQDIMNAEHAPLHDRARDDRFDFVLRPE